MSRPVGHAREVVAEHRTLNNSQGKAFDFEQHTFDGFARAMGATASMATAARVARRERVEAGMASGVLWM